MERLRSTYYILPQEQIVQPNKVELQTRYS